jgi:hypothetical protein
MPKLSRREFGLSIGGAAAGIAVLPLAGCGQTSVTQTLNLIVGLAEIVLPFLPGVNGVEAALINGYLSSVSDAVSYATTELASADTPTEKYVKIAAEFAHAAVPVLPVGIAQTIVTDIANVANAVANFLKTIQAAPAAARAGGYKAQLTSGDLKALPKIAKRAAALKAKLH